MLSRRPALVVGLAASLLLLIVTIPNRNHISYVSAKASERISNFRWHVDDSNDLGRTPSSSQASAKSDDSKSWGWWRTETSSNALGDDPSLAYRKHLEATTSPPEYKHSRTLTFSHIYVLNLHHRADRRERMKKIAHALGLDFTFVNATSKDLPVIQWIGERAKEVRKWKKPHLEKIAAGETKVGGMGIGSIWLWNNMTEKGLQLPDIRKVDKRWGGKSWVEYLEDSDPETLRPQDPHFNVTAELWDNVEGNDFRQIREAVIATWYSQSRVWNLMKANNDESALVLEDDVDLEWDIERLWGSAHRQLPDDWESAFLGHCWARELIKPTYFHPLLHQSSEPRCLHGYAFSRAGYNRVIEVMREPWIAYQTAVDTAIPTFITENMIKSFSIDPSLVIQAKDFKSDIQAGIGSPWRGVMMDSTIERIMKDEGTEVPKITWEDAIRNPHPDPAVLFRYLGMKVDEAREIRYQLGYLADRLLRKTKPDRPTWKRPVLKPLSKSQVKAQEAAAAAAAEAEAARLAAEAATRQGQVQEGEDETVDDEGEGREDPADLVDRRRMRKARRRTGTIPVEERI